MQTVFGTPDYIAPQVFLPLIFTDDDEDNDEALKYTVTVDIGSLGALVFCFVFSHIGHYLPQ